MVLRVHCNLGLFVLFWERESERERDKVRVGEGQRNRERERIWGSNSWTVRSWHEPKSGVGCLTNWAPRCPCNLYQNVMKENIKKKLYQFRMCHLPYSEPESYHAFLFTFGSSEPHFFFWLVLYKQYPSLVNKQSSLLIS